MGTLANNNSLTSNKCIACYTHTLEVGMFVL